MMRAVGLAILVVMAGAGCEASAPSASAPTSSARPALTPSASAPTPSARPAPACRLPVFWFGNAPGVIRTALVTVPGGSVAETPDQQPFPSGVLQLQGQFTYDPRRDAWLPVSWQGIAPGGGRYAYSAGDISGGFAIHVVDIASGSDTVAFRGPAMYFVVSFGSDAIYLVEGVRPRQGLFLRLYRLDPAGGEPRLVAGSDRHMYQDGWLLVADGAAWGVDYELNGSIFTYFLVRLDLGTGVTSRWMQSVEARFLPMGTDQRQRVYVTDGREVRRLAGPDRVELLFRDPAPGSYLIADFRSDLTGAWFGGIGGVWYYSDFTGAEQFSVTSEKTMVYPAGLCT